MNNQKIRTIYTFSLLLLDAVMIVLAFVVAYWLRTNLAWPEELNTILPDNSLFGFSCAADCGDHGHAFLLSPVLHSPRCFTSGPDLLCHCGGNYRHVDCSRSVHSTV